MGQKLCRALLDDIETSLCDRELGSQLRGGGDSENAKRTSNET
jgi:hypothetical protein